jgi:hypothetical protein
MFDRANIRTAIVNAAIQKEEPLSEIVAHDVAFHMTDWLGDFKELVKFFEFPESLTVEEVDSLLLRFLIHVPNHLAAAAKLYADTPVADIFSVGAVEQCPEA